MWTYFFSDTKQDKEIIYQSPVHWTGFTAVSTVTKINKICEVDLVMISFTILL